MAKKVLNIAVNEKLRKKSETFIKKISSNMHYKAELDNDSMSFDWVDEIDFACPYIDNIIRNPRLALITEEDVVKIGKAKKISVASVKDLSRNTHYIEKIDKKTNDVNPSKILIVRNEETFNTYENRFIYTLINNMIRFVTQKEELLEELKTKNDKVLEYAASTITGSEKVDIELKISSNELPKGKDGNGFEKEINAIRPKIKRIKDYIAGWKRSEFVKSLEKARASFVASPIRKTNMILKNPNFQIAMRLWTFLQTYDFKDNESSKDGLDTTGNDILKGVLDDSFLMDYFVLDSISSSKKEQKEKLSDYAVIMISQQIKRVISLLLNNGIKISDEELLSMVSNEIKNEKSKISVGGIDVKKKFKNVIDEYLERTQKY